MSYSRGLCSAGNQLSELLINTEMAFGKGIQMSIAGSPCLIEGTTLSSRQSWEIPWALPLGFPSSSGYSSLYIPLLVIIQIQYIILNNGILILNSLVLPLSEGFISQYTFLGVYGIIVNKTSLLCRLQAQTLTDATPPIGKIHPFSKPVEPMMGLCCPFGFRKFLITMT